MTGSPPSGTTSQSPAAPGDGPAMDILHTEHGYRICAGLPGLDARDVTIRVADGHVTLTGQARNSTEANARPFACVFALPEDADTDTARADLQNGLLTLTIHRKGTSPVSESRRGLRDFA